MKVLHIIDQLGLGGAQFILKGMACGLSLSLTDVGGTKELLENGKNGYLIRRKVRQLLKKINELANDKSKLIKMGKSSRRKAMNYSWEETASNYDNIYSKI